MVNVGDSGLHVELSPGSISAFLPKLHLSDHHSMCDALMLAYRSDDVIDRVMYLGKSGGVVSLKCTREDFFKTVFNVFLVSFIHNNL